MPQPGTLIEGKYEILGKIHEGGMGTIYKVRHRLLDEIRVVKVMKPSITADEELKRRFAEEAKMATRLKHPNIGTIHDFALDEDGTAYLVMEYIDGVNLAELLHTKGPPGIPLVLEITHQALLALGYLHRRNVIHRDVAPDNLMLTQNEEGQPAVKLIDLGIAKALDRPVDLTSTGVFLGKLKYASPEQYGSLPPGEKLDGRSDLYCLGVVIYELLTETRPFVGETPAELLRAHLFSPPIPFEQSDPEGRVPPEVRRIVLKTLEKKREDRFPTAEDFDREIVGLRHGYGETAAFDHTVQLFSASRMTPGVTKAQTITPSAQNRLDRQFVASKTPAGGSRAELPPVPTDAGETRKQAAPSSEAPPPRPSRKRALWIPAAAAVLIVAALLLRRPWQARNLPAPEPTAPAKVSAPAPRTESLETQATAAPIAAPTEPPPTPQAAPEPTAPPRATPSEESAADRATAEQARRFAARAQDGAKSAGAAEKAAALFASGRKAREDGDRLLDRKKYAAARAAFEKAAETFAAAQAQASQAPNKPPVVAVVPQPTPRAEPTRPPTAVAAVVAPTLVPPPARPVPNDQEKIRETIHRYERAQSELDADAYVRVFPSVDKDRIRAAFASFRSQTVEVAIQRVEISQSGSTAVVSAIETRSATPQVGNEQHFSGNRVLRLEKRGDVWVITGLGS